LAPSVPRPLNQIPGVEIQPEKVGACPAIPLAALEDAPSRRMFTDAFADLVLELRQVSSVDAG
jgi:hypothetical protein